MFEADVSRIFKVIPDAGFLKYRIIIIINNNNFYLKGPLSFRP